MADNKQGATPTVYEHKDGRVRVVETPAETVAAEFDGFVRQQAGESEPEDKPETEPEDKPKPRPEAPKSFGRP